MRLIFYNSFAQPRRADLDKILSFNVWRSAKKEMEEKKLRRKKKTLQILMKAFQFDWPQSISTQGHLRSSCERKPAHSRRDVSPHWRPTNTSIEICSKSSSISLFVHSQWPSEVQSTASWLVCHLKWALGGTNWKAELGNEGVASQAANLSRRLIYELTSVGTIIRSGAGQCARRNEQ